MDAFSQVLRVVFCLECNAVLWGRTNTSSTPASRLLMEVMSDAVPTVAAQRTVYEERQMVL